MSGGKANPDGGDPSGFQQDLDVIDILAQDSCNENYQRNVIGNMLNDNKLIDELSLDATVFDARHSTIYYAMLSLKRQGKPIDTLTTSEELESSGELEKIGGFTHLDTLASQAIHTNVCYHAEKLQEASQLKSLALYSYELTKAIKNKKSIETINRLKRSISESSTTSHFRLDTFSLQACDLENVEHEELITSFLHKRSFTLLSGKYGGGKSVLSLAIAKKLISQGEAVIYIDADMPLIAVDERLEKTMLKSHLNSDFFYLHRSKCDMKIGGKMWNQFVASMKNKKHHLIVLDNLKDLMPSKTNINLDSDVMPVLDEIKTLRDLGHTIILLHHVSKDASSDFKNSGSIADAVDIAYKIEKDESSGCFVLKCFKDRFSVKSSLSFEVSDDFSLIEVVTPEFEKMIDEVKQIYEIMQRLKSTGMEVHQKDIIEHLKGIISKNRVIDLLRKFEGKTWDVKPGDRKALVYIPKNPKNQNADYIYRRIFGIMESSNGEGSSLESPPEFL